MNKQNILFKTLIVFLFAGYNLFSQTCPASQSQWQWPTHTNWYYGKDKKLSFGAAGTGAATVSNLTSVQANTDDYVYEGCASASDDNGNLLFYTNGVTAWKGDGTVIPVPGGSLKSGAEIAGGHASSADQGVMIIRHPLNLDTFYIFTTDDAISGQAGFTYGINYSIYNSNNNTITAPVRIGNYRSTEQLAATFHSNGLDIWVVVHESTPVGTAKLTNTVNSDRYNAYLITASGINTTPVQSSLGFKVQNGEDWQFLPDRSNERASLRFSWDGTKAAATHHCGAGHWDPQNAVTIMDFNKSTGALSNAIGVNKNLPDYSNPYGCEFSPSNNRLYVSYLAAPWDNPAVQGKLEYINVASPYAFTNVASIGVDNDGGTVKLGGDGKMYFASFVQNPWGFRQYLSSVTTPDGAATFNANAINSQAGKQSYGLSNMFVVPQDYLVIAPQAELCTTDPAVNLSATWFCKGTNAEIPASFPLAWGGTGITDKANGIFNPNTAGVGNHVITMIMGDISDTIHINVKNCNVVCLDTTLNTPVVSICPAATYALNTFKTGTTDPGNWTVTGSGSNWPTVVGTTFTTTSSTPAGIYTVRYTLSPAPNGGCPTYNERTITVKALPIVSMADKNLCKGAAATNFDAGNAGSTYVWSGLGSGTAQTTSASVGGVYTVTVTTNGCSASGSATLTVIDTPIVSMLGKNICKGQSTSFDAGNAGAAFVWSDNGTGTAQTTPASVAGKYTVTVTKNGCSGKGSATLTVVDTPIVSMTNKNICKGQSTSFDAGNAGATFVWSDNGTGTAQTTPASVAGKYTVTVTKNGCSGKGSATLTVIDTPIVSMVNKSICKGLTTSFDAGNVGATYIWSDNGTGTAQTTSASTTGKYTVTVTKNGCSGKGSATLTVVDTPVVSMTNKSICVGGSTSFDAGNAGSTFLWSGLGSGTSQTTSASTSGVYTVTVSKNGCSGKGSAVLSVNNASVSIGDSSTCIGTSKTLSVPAGATSYTWTGPNSYTNNVSTITVSDTGTYTITIQAANGCFATDNMKLSNYLMTAIGLNDAAACSGATAILSAAGYNNPQWLGPNGFTSSSSSIATAVAGTYTLIAEDNNGCLNYDTAVITINPNPSVALGIDTALCFSENGTYIAKVLNNYTTYLWSNNETDTSITVTTAGTYWISVTNAFNCSDKDTIVLSEKCDPTIPCYPNVITPNGDGHNEVFTSCKSLPGNTHLQVYDRWGIKMYEATEHDPKWDGMFNGNKATSGVYYWIANYTDTAKNNYELTGWVQIID